MSVLSFFFNSDYGHREKLKAREILQGFRENAIKLEMKQNSVFQRDTKEWHEVLDNIGLSFHSLYKFHSFLIQTHPFYKDSKNYLTVKLYSFYIDMILSKLKHTFFTEYPKGSLNNLDEVKAGEIYLLAIKIINAEQKEVEKYLYLFYYKIFLFYDFIYDSDTDAGIFTKFALSQESFVKTKDVFSNIKCDNLYGFRKSIERVIPRILGKQIDLDGDSQYAIYQQYIFSHKPLEPLSYLLGFKIWKIGKLLQDKYESLTDEDIHAFEKNFLPAAEKYKNSHFDEIKKFYENTNQDDGLKNRDRYLQKSFEIDRDFFTKTVFCFLHPKDGKKPNQKIELASIPHNMKIEEKTISLGDIESIKDRISEDYKSDTPWKFNKLFYSSSKEELLNISYMLSYSDMHKESNIVGLYKSGAILAHIVNISRGIQNPVYLFTTFPYIAIHPRSVDVRGENNTKPFLLVDENYKTGFTVDICKSYLDRYKKHNISTITVVKHLDYISYASNTRSLAQIESYEKVDLPLFKKSFTYKTCSIEDFIQKIKDYHEDYLKPSNIYKYTAISVDEKIELDLTRLLSDTIMLFSVAYKFLSYMSLEKNNVVFLQAPTDAGRLIAESVAYIAKVLGYENKFLFNYNAHREEIDKKFYIDLSYISGYTLEYSTKRDVTEDSSFRYDGIYVIMYADDSKKNNQIEHIVKRGDLWKVSQQYPKI